MFCCSLPIHHPSFTLNVPVGGVADTCADGFPSMSIGGRVEYHTCINIEARSPIGVRHVLQNIFAHIDGGPSGVSIVRKHRREIPHWREKCATKDFRSRQWGAEWSIKHAHTQGRDPTLARANCFLLVAI